MFPYAYSSSDRIELWGVSPPCGTDTTLQHIKEMTAANEGTANVPHLCLG